MGASASVITCINFDDATLVQNESLIKEWDGMNEEAFELLKKAYEEVKTEPNGIILEKLKKVIGIIIIAFYIIMFAFLWAFHRFTRYMFKPLALTMDCQYRMVLI